MSETGLALGADQDLSTDALSRLASEGLTNDEPIPPIHQTVTVVSQPGTGERLLACELVAGALAKLRGDVVHEDMARVGA